MKKYKKNLFKNNSDSYRAEVLFALFRYWCSALFYNTFDSKNKYCLFTLFNNFKKLFFSEMQIQIENEETVWSVDPLQRAATAFFFSIANVRKTSKTEKQIVNFPCFPNVFG